MLLLYFQFTNYNVWINNLFFRHLLFVLILVCKQVISSNISSVWVCVNCIESVWFAYTNFKVKSNHHIRHKQKFSFFCRWFFERLIGIFWRQTSRQCFIVFAYEYCNQFLSKFFCLSCMSLFVYHYYCRRIVLFTLRFTIFFDIIRKIKIHFSFSII